MVKKVSLMTLLLLVACSTAQPIASSPEPSRTSVFTRAPTETSLPAATDTPMATATPVLPIIQGTPFPYQLPVISSENAAQLREVYRFQDEKPVVWDRFLVGSDEILNTSRGVIINDMQLPPTQMFCSSDFFSEYGMQNSKVFVSPNGQIAIVTDDGIQIYSAQGTLLSTLSLNLEFEAFVDDCGVEGIYRFSPNLEWVAVSYPIHQKLDDLTVYVYDLHTSTLATEIKNAYMPRYFSDDGKFLIVEDIEQRFLILQTGDWSRVATLPAADNFFRVDLRLSPDDQYLVAFPYLGNLTYYHLPSGNKFSLSAVPCGNFLNCNVEVLFSQDGKQLGVKQFSGDFLAFDLASGQQTDQSDTYNSNEWTPARPEILKSQEQYEEKKDAYFILADQNDFIFSVTETQSSNLLVSICGSPSGTDGTCYELPPVSEWEDSEIGKMIVRSLNDQVTARCIMFPDTGVDCSPADISSTEQLKSELTPDGSVIVKLSTEEVGFDPYMFYPIPESEFKAAILSIQGVGIFYCVVGPAKQHACWPSKDDAQAFNYMSKLSFERTESTLTNVCRLGFDGTQQCNSAPSETAIFIRGNQQYTLAKIEPNQLELRRAENNVPLMTLFTEAGEKVSWFQLLQDEKYLVYALENERLEVSIRVVSLDGKARQSQKTQFLEYHAASANGRYLGFAAYLNGSMRGFVWDIENLTTPFKWNIPEANHDALAFTPGSASFVYIERKRNKEKPWIENGLVRFVDLETQKVVNEFPVEFFHNGVNTMSFSPDGNLLAMGLNDGTVWLIDVGTGTQIKSWHAHLGQVQGLEFSPDGTKLLSSGTVDGVASVWGIYP